MGRGKREQNFGKRKLNLKKIAIVAVIVLVIIVAILVVINRDKIFKNNSKEEKQVPQNKIDTVSKEKTIEEILAEFGGETIEQPKDDTYIVKKEEKTYTIYADGEIIEGKINIWNGESKEPSVDEAGNYNIYSAEELKWIANKVINGEKNFSGSTITLRTNIDLGARQKDDGTWEGTAWTSIVGFLDELPKDEKNTTKTEEKVEDGENLKRFAGCFDGNNLNIRGLYINSDKNYQGLFGYSSGTIQNLNLKNSYITGGNGTGAIVGLNGGVVSNCKIDNSVIEGKDSKVGSIVGITMTSSTINQCSTNSSTVTGKDYVGGIVGYINNNVTISDNMNGSNVKGENYIGGIAGISFYGTSVKSGFNTGKIEGTEYVGGILGYSQAQVEKIYNLGEVTGQNNVSGLIGVNYTMGDITQSYNKGRIVGETNVGGISGINNASISNCYNIGDIKANNYRAGGICGQNGTDSFVYTCYSIGKIDGKDNINGICGGNFGTITTCYYLKESTSSSNPEQEKKEDDMKNNILESIGQEFKADSENINSGYPLLNWQ